MPTDTCPQKMASPVDLGAVAGGTRTSAVCRKDRVARTLFVAVDKWEAAQHRWLMRHSITALRISMGLVIFGFGVLKYFPGFSPAQDLILADARVLSFGLVPAVVPGSVVMVLIATVECVIGLSLITGRALRVINYLIASWIVGILSPIVVLPARLFSGPDHMPTMEGQYVLKDVILLAAAMVIATTVRGGAITDAGHRSLPAE
ncbi:MAG: hypothetical protein ACRDRS_02755 [Pseudonocardiaceae bacterium]